MKDLANSLLCGVIAFVLLFVILYITAALCTWEIDFLKWEKKEGIAVIFIFSFCFGMLVSISDYIGF